MSNRTGLLAVVLPFLAGCGGAKQVEAPPRSPGPPVPIKSFVLHDVQGLWGGQAIWAAEDRTAIVQVVGSPPAGQSGLWEKRYRIKITAEQWGKVERLVGAHHLLATTIPERQGKLDEVHPIIRIVTQDGTTIRLLKWHSDTHPDFDPVYEHLLGLCRVEGMPAHEGAFDWDWRPAGFTAPWE